MNPRRHLNPQDLPTVAMPDGLVLVTGAGSILGPGPGMVADGPELVWAQCQLSYTADGQPEIVPVKHVAGVPEAAAVVAAIYLAARIAGPRVFEDLIEQVSAANAVAAQMQTLIQQLMDGLIPPAPGGEPDAPKPA